MTLLISFGVMSFLSAIISNMGNSIQRVYFDKWGGAPTTTLLMPDNDELDIYTKQRYFVWLNSKIPDLNLSMTVDEKEDHQHKARSAINFLREYTRDIKKYPAVYRDNVSYGFARNLVALRHIGLIISVVGLAINTGIMLCPAYNTIALGSALTVGSFPLGIVSSLLSLLCVMLFLFVLNEGFVKQRAFRYARSLLEVCEMGE